MHFLRRLHPGHATAPHAARIDASPRWLESMEPLPDAELPATSRPWPLPLPLQVTTRAAVQPEEPADADSVTAAVPSAIDRIAPRGLPRTAASVAAHAEPSPPVDAAAAVGQPKISVAAPVRPIHGRDAQVAPIGRAQAPHAADDKPAPQALQAPAAPSRPRVPAQPLRAAALIGRVPPHGPAESGVVQVTIDRIDVRLPAPSAAQGPPTQRRPRPVMAVAPLAEYLRGGGRGGGA